MTKMTPEEEVRRWKDLATPRELETCPKCGIAWYWLKRAHPNVRPTLDKCGDPFHSRDDVEPVSSDLLGEQGGANRELC